MYHSAAGAGANVWSVSCALCVQRTEDRVEMTQELALPGAGRRKLEEEWVKLASQQREMEKKIAAFQQLSQVRIKRLEEHGES